MIEIERRGVGLYLFEIRCTPAVSGKSDPDLLNKYTPNLRFRLAAFCSSSRLKIEHPLCQWNEVR